MTQAERSPIDTKTLTPEMDNTSVGRFVISGAERLGLCCLSFLVGVCFRSFTTIFRKKERFIMSTKMSKNTQMLCISAVMLALATILSLLKVFELPFGGSITFCSMLPIVYIAYRYGNRWGILAGFVFSLIQLLTGLNALKGLSAGSLIASLVLDYFIAFSVLGLGGMFRRLIPNKTLAFTLGYAVCTTLRYLCHIVSGFILWASAENIAWFFGEGAVTTDLPFKLVQTLYSVVYNGCYMVPEIIIGSVAAVILSFVAKPLFVIENAFAKKEKQAVNA